MGLKLINVDDKKWKKFGKYCVNKDMTIKKAMDIILDKVLRGEII